MPDETESIEWLAAVIATLPSDEAVPRGTPGYNAYTTQKAHWLGWLNPGAGTGTYPRSDTPNRSARDVYNRIVEPKLLLWLVAAAGVSEDRVDAARNESAGRVKLSSKSAAIRKHIPWSVLVDALRRQESRARAD